MKYGLRMSEATGLTVDRVDFLRRTLTVERQLETLVPLPDPYVATFAPPKGDRSYRTVPLAEVALNELSAHIAEFGTGEADLILHDGPAAIRRQRFSRLWLATREGAGCPDGVFHRLRHAYASTLLSAGVSVAAVAEYLGHSPAELLKSYAHLMPADHDRARALCRAHSIRRELRTF